MASPIGKANEERVSWASRTDSQHSHSPAASLSSAAARSQVNESIPEENENESPPSESKNESNLHGETSGVKESKPIMLFSPDHQAVDSPQPVTQRDKQKLDKFEAYDGKGPPTHVSGEASTAPPRAGQQLLRHQQSRHSPTSAPAVMGRPHGGADIPKLAESSSASVTLNPEAPIAARRDHADTAPLAPDAEKDKADAVLEARIKRRDMHDSASGGQTASGRAQDTSSRPLASAPLPLATRSQTAAQQDQQQMEDSQWGTSFKVQWIKVQRLPFHRTRHLRNPWNHDREVKVSRDGTELEPGVGQALLDEWEKEDLNSPAPSSSPLAEGGDASEAIIQRNVPAQTRGQSQPNPLFPTRQSELRSATDSPRANLRQRPR
jgi:hypothetical protein